MSVEPGAFGVCGGGTGGHIFPALAVIEALQRLAPERPVHYFGKIDGMERPLVEGRGLAFHGLQLAGLARRLTWSNWTALRLAGQGFITARRWLQEYRIGAVLGTGGFVSGPVIAAGVSLGIPTLIHESNLVPGLTNRWLGAWVTRVAVSQVWTAKYFPEGKVVVSGFPLRGRLNRVGREEGCREFGLDPAGRVLLVFPGSLAAHRINQAVADLLPRLKKHAGVQLLWMTGEADLEMARVAFERAGTAGKVLPFIHAVPEAYAAADLVLARAGAGTVAELSATGKPALLVPYPYATNNHQTQNADLLQKAGVAEVLEDRLLTAEALWTHLQRMLKRLDDLSDCGQVLQASYPKNAAEQLARIMVEFVERTKKPRSTQA